MKTKPIQQTVHFPVSAAEFWKFWFDGKSHAQALGASVTISEKVGANYRSWGDYISGKTLHLEKPRLLVQTWRASDWAEGEGPSILILEITDKGRGCEVSMTHAGFPPAKRASLDKGWRDYYWKPLSAFFRKPPR
ncbi:MAG: SRPBCC domain-containing protein [Spirochaetes bacterium]|nr:SRPBCC domain-containing protein [Spirochaetota bacterium]